MANEIIQFNCRLCLRNSEFYYSIFDENLVEIIEILTSIKIKKDDGLTSNCCSKCLEQLHLLTSLRDKIIESDKILRTKVKESSMKVEIKVEDIETKLFDIEEDDNEVKVTPGNLPVEESDENTENSTGNTIIFVSESNEEIVAEDLDFISKDLKDGIKIDLDSKGLFSKYEDEIYASTTNESQLKINPICLNNLIGVYKCFDCEKEFKTRKTYLEHMKIHRFLTKCNICQAEVKEQHYRRHMDIHQSGPQICELCGAVAKNVESLRGHIFYMHKHTAQQYKCEKCSKYFRFKYKYRLHMTKYHGGSKSHVCEVCGKGFYTLRDLQRHNQMTHLKLRPYVCPFCEKGFSSQYAKKTHIRRHTNERPYRCNICSSAFSQRVSLKTHYKSKHGVIYVPPPSINNPNINVMQATNEDSTTSMEESSEILGFEN